VVDFAKESKGRRHVDLVDGDAETKTKMETTGPDDARIMRKKAEERI
jgi:hypothetical protein